MEQQTIRPDRRGFFITNYSWVSILALFGVASFLASLTGSLPIGALVWLGIFAATAIIAALGWYYTKIYCSVTSISMAEDKLVYETGIFSHRRKNIPIHMVTDTSLNRSFFQKLIGVCTLNVSTSGSSGYELAIPNLPHGPACEFHDALYGAIQRFARKNVSGYKRDDEDGRGHAQAEKREPLYTPPPREEPPEKPHGRRPHSPFYDRKH